MHVFDRLFGGSDRFGIGVCVWWWWYRWIQSTHTYTRLSRVVGWWYIYMYIWVVICTSSWYVGGVSKRRAVFLRVVRRDKLVTNYHRVCVCVCVCVSEESFSPDLFLSATWKSSRHFHYSTNHTYTEPVRDRWGSMKQNGTLQMKHCTFYRIQH